MDEHYEALCGITEEELYSTFDEQIKAMAVRYKTTEEGMKYKLKRKFDGYHKRILPLCKHVYAFYPQLAQRLMY